MNWRALFCRDVRTSVVLIAVALTWLTMCEGVRAETRLKAGIGYEPRWGNAPFCHDSAWTGTFGIERDVTLPGLGEVVIGYEHNSCLDEEDDRAVSDRIQIEKVWRFNW